MNTNRIAEFRSKEIINIHDGMRFGTASDLEFSIESGKIVALIVPGPYRFLGLFGKTDDYIIPWESIQRIGEDIILVDFEPGRSFFSEKREKQHNFMV